MCVDALSAALIAMLEPSCVCRFVARQPLVLLLCWPALKAIHPCSCAQRHRLLPLSVVFTKQDLAAAGDAVCVSVSWEQGWRVAQAAVFVWLLCVGRRSCMCSLAALCRAAAVLAGAGLSMLLLLLLSTWQITCVWAVVRCRMYRLLLLLLACWHRRHNPCVAQLPPTDMLFRGLHLLSRGVMSPIPALWHMSCAERAAQR